MSQRLLIARLNQITPDDRAYYDFVIDDAIADDEVTVVDGLFREWLCYSENEGYFLGPWHIVIKDCDLWSQCKPYIKNVLTFMDEDVSLDADIIGRCMVHWRIEEQEART